MSLLLGLFLVVHACIHVGYICGPAWPFEATPPWLAAGLGTGSAGLHDAGIVLVLVTLVGYLLAAMTAVGLLPARCWAPLVAIASVASAIVLIAFATPWTLPGLAIDGVLLWATLARGWHPTAAVGR